MTYDDWKTTDDTTYPPPEKTWCKRGSLEIEHWPEEYCEICEGCDDEDDTEARPGR